MDNEPQQKIYLTPQEGELFKKSTADRYEGDARRNLFIISPATSLKPSPILIQNETVDIPQQREMRGDGFFVAMSPWYYEDNPELMNKLKINKEAGEVLAMKLQKINDEGMTEKDPEFAVAKLDKETGQYIPVEDEGRGISVAAITEIYYGHCESGERPGDTVRDIRIELGLTPQNPPEGQQGSGLENLG